MRTKMTFIRPASILIAAACLSQSCQDKGSSDSNAETGIRQSQELSALADIDLENQSSPMRKDLADIFCVHAYKLPHPADFDAELGVLCADGKPTATFLRLDQLATSVGTEPQSVELELKHDGDFTDAVYAAAYHLPIPPKWVRNGSIESYMMSDAKFDYLELDGEISGDMRDQITDLEFSHKEFTYNTTSKPAPDKTFSNQRVTEFHAYQVQGGNPDIGLGTEHLIRDDKGDHKYFNTITVTIATESGGSLVLTLIRGSVRNNGYPEVSRRIFSDTTNVQATAVHAGIGSEMADYAVENQE